MITEYISHIMSQARYEILEDDEGYYGEIPGFAWVWANASTLEGCRRELQETLEEWLLIKVRSSKYIPTTKKYNLNAVVCHN